MSVPAIPVPLFTDIDDVSTRLAETGYLPDTATATAVFLADRLGKPLLVEGPAGVGKTELARALAALDARDRELVLLVAWEGLSLAEAAAALGCRSGTAAVRLHRARRRLHTALRDEGPALASMTAVEER